MAKHNNPSIVQDSLRIFNSKITDNISSQVGDIVVPVIPIERIVNVVKSGARTSTGSANVFTTPADKDFYLVGFQMNYQCDVACDATTYTLNVGLNGISTIIYTNVKLSLTATTRDIAVMLPKPILLDKASTVLFTQLFTVGAGFIAGTIYGFTVETDTTTRESA